ncbi:SDR family oxidoreductase [Pseudoalteromonas piscicida]|uniref:SDR family oxidoreductase n=1 Tax=Pseudoalteromonas piscicida TaxID=43662 RepID=UPI002738ABC1|nr:SDR family oxidoreductase [Pseudoalteromonas piscicida]MDP4489645.1 SDR family oxidoreductase [Pseudoalteromonas piscicida]
MSLPTILITGATAGIGLAAAKHYLTQGWKVIFTGRNEDKIATVENQLLACASHPSQVLGLLCDSSIPAHFESLPEELKAQDIKLDAVILNAGVFYPKPFADNELSDLNTTMLINFTGPAMLLQRLLPVMNNPCSVVYVSSIAVQRAFAGAASYAASKAAFEALAATLNLEWSDRGVRINHLRPGVTHTEIQNKAGMSEQQIAELNAGLSSIPLGRMLQATEMLASLDFLTGEGSTAMRGAHITVDGGYCL